MFSPAAERVCCYACNCFFFVTVLPSVELSLSDWKKAEERTNSHANSGQNWQCVVQQNNNIKQSLARNMGEQ